MDEREKQPPAEGFVIPPRPPLPPRPSDEATAEPAADTVAVPAADTVAVPAEPEATTLPLPVVGAPASQPAQAAPPAPKKARRSGRAPVIWTVAVIAVLGVVGVIGWFVGEAWAEQTVTAEVQQQTAKALGISDPSTIDVGLAKPVLPQVIGGSLTTLDVTAPGTPIGGATATVTMHATALPIRGGGDPASATASVSMPPDALTSLAGSLGDIVPGSLQVSGSDVAVTLNPLQFLSRVSVVVTLTPSVSGGQLVLTPSAFTVGSFDMSADTIRERFGGLADGMLAPRTLCVASALPKGLTLTAVQVSPTAVVADFDVDPGIANDPALQAKGTCG